MKDKELGDCFYVSSSIALGNVFGSKLTRSMIFIGKPHVVHAVVTGHGLLVGIMFAHAWIEDDVLVYDFSCGRKIIYKTERKTHSSLLRGWDVSD